MTPAQGVDDKDADRLFAAALARHRAGDLAGAISLYGQVAALLPDKAAPLINLGLARQGMEDHDLALRTFRRAICLEPGNAAAWSALGGGHQSLGQGASAVMTFSRAVRLDPFDVGAHNNFGNALAALGQTELAIVALRRAVMLGPDNPQPYNNLGAALIEAGAFAEGLVACARALMLRPDNPEGENNLGNALVELGRGDEAIGAFCRALALQPDFPEVRVNLSGALIDGGACGEAIRVCRNAIGIRPEDARAYNNLGNALRGAGALGEAVQVFRHALLLAPEDAEIHYNKSAVLLKLGRLREGWAEFEWRKSKERSLFRTAPLPGAEWDGQPLNGRTLLLNAEQGYGDVLQFVRYAPIMAMRGGGTVLLRVYPPLVRLLSDLPGITGVLSTEDPLPAFDCHLPMMSLPFRMGTVLENIPATVPYLTVDSVAVRRWHDRLSGAAGCKVGLVWAGDPRKDERCAHLIDQRRSLPLAAFGDLLRIPGVQWTSLQKGVAAAQARTPPAGTVLFDPMDEIGDFADTAALVMALDLVITVDTAIAHLAGALGKTVWILSRFDGCWRWFEGRDDSPWYPSARLYRQEALGDWTSVLVRLAGDLRALTTRASFR